MYSNMHGSETTAHQTVPKELHQDLTEQELAELPTLDLVPLLATITLNPEPEQGSAPSVDTAP